MEKLIWRICWMVIRNLEEGTKTKTFQEFRTRPVWQGVSTDSLEFHPLWARYAQPFYALRASHPQNSLMAVMGMTRPQGGQLAVVFYPLGYPMSYGPV
jgi:hypothetical protein